MELSAIVVSFLDAVFEASLSPGKASMKRMSSNY